MINRRISGGGVGDGKVIQASVVVGEGVDLSCVIEQRIGVVNICIHSVASQITSQHCNELAHHYACFYRVIINISSIFRSLCTQLLLDNISHGNASPAFHFVNDSSTTDGYTLDEVDMETLLTPRPRKTNKQMQWHSLM